MYNAGVRGRQCEGSVWYGALHAKLPSDQTIDVFKSWAERRRADPTHILLERRFKHPLISRSTIQAARALRPLQGRHDSLAPHSPTLASLNMRLAARGLTGVSYDR